MKTTLFTLCILFFGMQSCGERTLIRYYYILELPANGDYFAETMASDSGICEIMNTEIPPAFAQLRIAVRKKSNEISYYQYSYWAMNPSDNLTFLLAQQVDMSKIFAHSQSGLLKKIPDFQIKSYVYNLEVLDNSDSYYAHLQMKMELIDYANQALLVTHTFDRTKALEERDLNLFASELSVIFQEEVSRFISKMQTYFEKKNAPLPAQ